MRRDTMVRQSTLDLDLNKLWQKTYLSFDGFNAYTATLRPAVIEMPFDLRQVTSIHLTLIDEGFFAHLLPGFLGHPASSEGPRSMQY